MIIRLVLIQFFLIYFSCFQCFSDNVSLLETIKGVVIDSITGKPIPYALIEVMDLDIRVVADEGGRFLIPQIVREDNKLSAYCLGFERRVISLDRNVLSNNQIEIFLNPASLDRKSVV